MEVGQINGIECGLTLDEISRYAAEQIQKQFNQGVAKVTVDPASFSEVEHETMQFGQEIAGLIAASVLADSTATKRVEEEAKEIRRESGKSWRYVRRACRTVTLLCGLTLSICASYWLPRNDPHKAGRHRGSGKRGKEGVGIYPELSALGIREGVSASMQEEVARTTIFMPSFSLSQQELAHRGIELDIKTIRRITLELGRQALSARKTDLQLWREGKLPEGTDFKGKRVVVAIDGGRTRTRKNRAGRKTKKKRHRFDTPWREPKLLVIYAVNDDGRHDPSVPYIIETGMQGPDQIAELAAFHLHLSGAAGAEEVVFLGDGAEWIWDRVPMIAKRAGLKNWLAGVDFCHVMGYVGKAVKSSIQDKKTAKARTKKVQQALLSGQVEDALSMLQDLPGGDIGEDVQNALRYIKNRRALMKYHRLKEIGLPIGSGAVESAVRRVINLRIKSPGMFWEEDNVEAFMYLRANALSGQWGNMLHRVHKHTRTTRQWDWKWALTPYSIKADENKICEPLQLVIKEAA